MISTNKLSLYYLYFKLRYYYKNLENKRSDMKLLDLFKLQSEIITAHISLTIHLNVKVSLHNRIYRTKNKERLSKITTIQIVTKILSLHKICIPSKMLEPKSFIKTKLQNLYYLIQQYHTTPLLIALQNTFISRQIHYITSMVHLDISPLNIISMRYYPHLSLVTSGICIKAHF